MTAVRFIGLVCFIFGTAQVWREGTRVKQENERKRARLEQRRSAFRRKPDQGESDDHGQHGADRS